MSLNSARLDSSQPDGSRPGGSRPGGSYLRREIQTIFVPAGAEYRAVKGAMKKALSKDRSNPRLVPIPAGPQAVRTFLSNWKDFSQLEGGVLLMGLGGSLSSDYAVGEGVMIEQIWRGFEGSGTNVAAADEALTRQIAQRLGLSMGVGVTCDRVITTVREKQQLGDRYGGQVVDMEGFSLLEELSRLAPKCSVAMLRVISDGCDRDLPDISNAIRSDGSLSPWAIARSFATQPIAARRLVSGSLKGLKALNHITKRLLEAQSQIWPGASC